jgi:hypothetical protein
MRLSKVIEEIESVVDWMLEADQEVILIRIESHRSPDGTRNICEFWIEE